MSRVTGKEPEDKIAGAKIIGKRRCTRMQIPKEDLKDYIVLKYESDIMYEPIDNIKRIHPYCLSFNVAFGAYLPEKIQMAFTPQQLAYIPESVMVEFSDKFFEENLKKAAKDMDKEYSVDYVFRYDNKDNKIQSIKENLYDKLMITYARKKTAQQEIDRIKNIREKKDEAQWRKNDEMHTIYLSAILSLSIRTIQKIWPDLLIDKKGNRIQYVGVLRKLEECAVYSENSEKAILPYGKIENGKLHLDELPLLYDRKTVYNSCGFVLRKPKPSIVNYMKEKTEEEGIYFQFPANQKTTLRRYTKYDVEMLKRDAEVIKEREKSFSRMGLNYNPEKHKLQY